MVGPVADRRVAALPQWRAASCRWPPAATGAGRCGSRVATPVSSDSRARSAGRHAGLPRTPARARSCSETWRARSGTPLATTTWSAGSTSQTPPPCPHRAPGRAISAPMISRAARWRSCPRSAGWPSSPESRSGPVPRPPSWSPPPAWRSSRSHSSSRTSPLSGRWGTCRHWYQNWAAPGRGVARSSPTRWRSG